MLYRALADVFRALGDSVRFYTESLAYLAYTAVEAIPVTERPRIAQEVAEAALLSPTEFRFGELLEKPLIKSDLGDGTVAVKLRTLLQAFYDGSFDQFDVVMAGDVLRAHRAALATKMQLAAVMELVFQRAKRDRRVTFTEISTQCRCDPSEVEQLVMRAISRKLVEGCIDQVERTVTFTWVKPRVLDEGRVRMLEQRIEAWGARAKSLVDHLEDLTPELLVS